MGLILDIAASPTAGEPSRAASSLGFAVTLAVLATALASTLGLQLAAKFEPSRTGNTGLAYRVIWPQGWTFFASYADSATLSVFQVTPGVKEPPPLIPRQMSSRTLWGLSGASEARVGEAQYIKGLIPARSWHPCSDPVTARCFSSTPPLSLVNQAKPASLCGLVAFVSVASETKVGARPAAEIAITNLICPT